MEAGMGSSQAGSYSGNLTMAQGVTDFQNTSGLGWQAQIPPEVRGLSWGGLLMGWKWAFAHNLWALGVITFFLPLIGNLILFFIGIPEAWKARSFRSVKEFWDVQRAWTIIGLVYWGMIAGVFMLYLFFLLVAFTISGMVSPGP